MRGEPNPDPTQIADYVHKWRSLFVKIHDMGAADAYYAYINGLAPVVWQYVAIRVPPHATDLEQAIQATLQYAEGGYARGHYRAANQRGYGRDDPMELGSIGRSRGGGSRRYPNRGAGASKAEQPQAQGHSLAQVAHWEGLPPPPPPPPPPHNHPMHPMQPHAQRTQGSSQDARVEPSGNGQRGRPAPNQPR